MTKTLDYSEFKEQQRQEINEFTKKNCVWAFGAKQYQEMLQRINMTEEQFKEAYTSFPGGGAILKTAVQDWKTLCERQEADLGKIMRNDVDFAKQAFRYEFSNYECGISMRYDEARAALGLTMEDINNNEILLTAYKLAKKDYEDWCMENIW